MAAEGREAGKKTEQSSSPAANIKNNYEMPSFTSSQEPMPEFILWQHLSTKSTVCKFFLNIIFLHIGIYILKAVDGRLNTDIF
jgi:hypothetical protein